MSTGPLVTSSLLFVAQKDEGRNLLRAFDKETGEIITAIELPETPWGTPMTYLSGGRQFIVLAIGEANKAKLIALALPN